jgi:hypothetical protein
MVLQVFLVQVEYQEYQDCLELLEALVLQEILV